MQRWGLKWGTKGDSYEWASERVENTCDKWNEFCCDKHTCIRNVVPKWGLVSYLVLPNNACNQWLFKIRYHFLSTVCLTVPPRCLLDISDCHFQSWTLDFLLLKPTPLQPNKWQLHSFSCLGLFKALNLGYILYISSMSSSYWPHLARFSHLHCCPPSPSPLSSHAWTPIGLHSSTAIFKKLCQQMTILYTENPKDPNYTTKKLIE